VFAGHDGTKRLNDLWVLNIESFGSITPSFALIDLDNLEWTQPTLSLDSTMPPARAGHTADPVGRNIFVYGGGDGKVLSDLYYFNVDTLTWSRMNGTSPGRCAHSSTAIDGKLYIFAGGNGTKYFRDMYIFDAGS
jgi:N-acetylneuraminic acid mutarotase